MKPTALEALATVRNFLATEVLDGVPRHLSGDLRAAVKVLDEVRAEIDELAPVQRQEWDELVAACQACEPYLGPGDAATRLTALRADTTISQRWSDGMQLQRDLRGILKDSLPAVQAVARDEAAPPATREAARVVLADVYAMLSRHAGRRAQWQSVFAPRTAQ